MTTPGLKNDTIVVSRDTHVNPRSPPGKLLGRADLQRLGKELRRGRLIGVLVKPMVTSAGVDHRPDGSIVVTRYRR